MMGWSFEWVGYLSQRNLWNNEEIRLELCADSLEDLKELLGTLFGAGWEKTYSLKITYVGVKTFK